MTISKSEILWYDMLKKLNSLPTTIYTPQHKHNIYTGKIFKHNTFGFVPLSTKTITDFYEIHSFRFWKKIVYMSIWGPINCFLTAFTAATALLHFTFVYTELYLYFHIFITLVQLSCYCTTSLYLVFVSSVVLFCILIVLCTRPGETQLRSSMYCTAPYTDQWQ